MQMLMCPPAFYGIEYEINPWVNRSRPSRYLLAQEQYRGGKKCNHESRLPSNQQPVPRAGIFRPSRFLWASLSRLAAAQSASSFTSLMD